MVAPPFIEEQIAWFRKRVADADQLRQIHLRSGNLPDIPRIPGWLSAHFRLSKARSNEIRPPPTG